MKDKIEIKECVLVSKDLLLSIYQCLEYVLDAENEGEMYNALKSIDHLKAIIKGLINE